MAKRVDRRVERTKLLLQQTLLTLIRERGFERLSVQDIIDRANVGRATFYAHFENKEDLLASGIERLRTSLRELQRPGASKGDAPEESLFAFSRELFAHANAHREVFQAMVGKRSGAIIQQLLNKMLVDLVRAEVTPIRGMAASGPMPSEAVAHFVGGGLFGLLMWWGNGKMRMPIDAVNTVFRRLAIPAVKNAS